MARKIVWSPTSLADLQQIFNYIARDSEAYAAGAIEKIVDASERLLIFPRMGRVVPEFSDDTIRELVVFSYRLIYQINGDRIDIGAVVHGSRELKRALKGRGIRSSRRRSRDDAT